MTPETKHALLPYLTGRPWRRGLVWALPLFAVALALPVSAGNRALIIGVGEYRDDAVSDLPGIDLDMTMMQDVAKNLGFRSSEITTLQDENATLAAITREVRNLSSAGREDRVLIYFSGHGTHIADKNGDEADDRDEVLTPHDVRLANGTVENGLVDDDFAKLLAKIPSRRLLLLIDACHSGTATKSFSNLGLRGTPKYFAPPSAMTKSAPLGGGASARNFEVTERQSHAHVMLSAALDSELAQATPQGSAFTLGVFHAVNKAGADRALTPKQLAGRVQTFIRETLDDSKAHTPQLSGADDRVNANIFFAKPAIGPMRERLDRLVARMTAMQAGAPQDTYQVGQNMTFTLDIPIAGYLNVVNVNANDNAIVLFPNKFHSNNRVQPGRLRLPTPEMPFDITVQKPRGDNITYAFLTSKPVDLYKSAVEGRSEKGIVVDTLVPLSPSGYMQTRNLVPESRTGAGGNYAAKVTLNVE